MAAGSLVASEAVPVQDAEAEEEGRRELPDGVDRMFVPRWRLADGPQTRAAFRDVVKEAQAATLCVHSDGEHVSLGCIVGAEGWALTKASTLGDELICHLADGREFPAEVVRVNGDFDLALLKIDAGDLPTIRFEPAADPSVGSWVASVGKGRDPVGVGVVSVAARQIPGERGVLGVQLDEVQPLVVQVFADSGAEQAGVLVNDVILSVNGRETPTREALVGTVQGFNPGDEVELVVRRDEQQLTLQAVLSGRFPGVQNRSDFQNSLGGPLSVRRFGFPAAIQHDTVLRPSDCGGPIVDLDGKVLGVNIARAGRTESYALPAAAIAELLGDWLGEEAGTVDALQTNLEAAPTP
jgi:serine protease Do